MDQACSSRITKLLFAALLSGWAIGVAGAQQPGAPAASPAAPAAQAPAAAEKPSLEIAEPADKVVLKIGNQQFTKADMDMLISSLPPQAQRSIATQGKKSLGEQYATIVALSQQAQLHHLDQSPEFMRKLALEKQQMEAQAAYAEVNDQATVTPEDVQQYYNAHAAEYDEIVVRQIVIRKKPAQLPTAQAQPPASTAPGLTPEEAKQRAEAIRKELAAGTDIKKVADEFKSPGDVIIEPEPRTIRRGSMRPDMEKVAFALKDGEISEPVDLPQALIIFQAIKHDHADLKTVTPDIERTLRQEKIKAALDTIKKNANVWMDDQYFAAPPKVSAAPAHGTPPVNSSPTL